MHACMHAFHSWQEEMVFTKDKKYIHITQPYKAFCYDLKKRILKKSLLKLSQSHHHYCNDYHRFVFYWRKNKGVQEKHGKSWCCRWEMSYEAEKGILSFLYEAHQISPQFNSIDHVNDSQWKMEMLCGTWMKMRTCVALQRYFDDFFSC